MKKQTILRIASIALPMLLVGLVLFGLMTLPIIAGVSWAMATGATPNEALLTKTVHDNAADLDTDDVSQKVCLMKPAATPLDTILRTINKDISVKSLKTEFYAVDTKALTDTVATAHTHSTGSGVTTKALVVDNAAAWKPDDTVEVVGVTGTDGGNLVCHISSVSTSAGTITIQALNGTVDSGGANDGEIIVPSIAEDAVLVRMAPAKYETDAQTTPYSAVPDKTYNYMQMFMAQVEQSKVQRDHSTEVPWGFSDLEALNVYDLRATMEYSFLNGFRSKSVSAVDGLERYFTGGILRSVTKAISYGTGGTDRTIDNDTFVNWTKTIFTGNSGSSKRLLFAGNGLLSYMHGADIISKQLQSNQTEVVHGITFNKIVTNFGILMVYHHPLFNLNGWNDKGLVLDLNNIEKRVFQKMDILPIDLAKAGTRKSDAHVLSETSCVVTRYPDTHAIISPAS